MRTFKVIAGLAALVLPIVNGPAWAQEFNLRVADSFPTTHQYSKNTKEWLDLITERTDGRITFDYFPAEQLAKSADLLDAAQSGLADMVYVSPLYMSDRLPLSSVAALPLVGNVTDQLALNEAFQSLVMNELNDAEVLPLGVRAVRGLVTAPYQIMSRKDKIDTLEQLKGLKIRSSGGVQETSVSALGAVPVAIPAPDLYPALQRGTVDGILFNLPTAAGYKLQEQLVYSTDNLNLGLFPVMYVINEDVWQTLPEDIRRVMIETAMEVLPTVLEADKNSKEDFRSVLEANGGGLYQIDDSQIAEWNERLVPVYEEWIQRLEALNMPARAILDRWTELVTQ